MQAKFVLSLSWHRMNVTAVKQSRKTIPADVAKLEVPTSLTDGPTRSLSSTTYRDTQDLMYIYIIDLSTVHCLLIPASTSSKMYAFCLHEIMRTHLNTTLCAMLFENIMLFCKARQWKF